jgi:hypothetical protein
MLARTGLMIGVSLVGLSLFGAAAASAQGLGSGGLGGPASPTVPPALSPTPGLAGQAPVGHIQPRRDAIQDDDNPFKETPEDKALDRKIKSICRGC